VFITGGSSGIRLALVHCVATKGACISILARSMEKLEKVRNTIHPVTRIEVATFAANMRNVEESCGAFVTDVYRPSTTNLANLEGEKREKERREMRKFFLKILLVN